MIINTKFDVGNNVFYLDWTDQSVKQSEVLAINITVAPEAIHKVYTIKCNTVRPTQKDRFAINEDKLFESKQELLNSL